MSAINNAISSENVLRRNEEADEAFNEYRETGQYVSHEKVDAWLKTWGTDKEKQCPINQN